MRAAGRGLTLINRGLPEFSVGEDGTVRLTLLRAVGYLSREDLLTRVGGAGPTIPTPDAQLPGTFEAHYSVVAHAGDWHVAESWREAHAFNAPLHTQTRVSQILPLRNVHRSEEPSLPPRAQLIRLEGAVLAQRPQAQRGRRQVGGAFRQPDAAGAAGDAGHLLGTETGAANRSAGTCAC